MHKFLIILCAVICAAGMVFAQDTAGAPGIGDDYFPELGNGGYDTQHYRLDLAWDDDSNNLSGTTTISASAMHDLTAFNLDFLGFDISEITVNGQPAEFDRKGRELVITPPKTLQTGVDFTVAISYSGVPGEGVPNYYDVFARGWTRHDDGVYVASEPNGAAYWYPVNDHPLDKAAYTFEITVPQPYVVAANGILENTVEDGDRVTYTWEAENPIASYLVTVNIGDFVVDETTGPGDLPIRNYFPSSIFPQGVVTFRPTAKIIEFFSDTFGPYPFEAYGVVVADVRLGFALETQTLSLFGRDAAGGGSRSENVVAHELAHQWFGNSVSLAEWKDIWLNEVFATYAAALWAEHTAGPEALDNYMRGIYLALANPLSSNRFVAPGDPPKDDLVNSGVYVRGAWVLHALRLKVGDEPFFNILRTYYDRYKYSNATAADFINIAEEISGQQLDEFFDGWLYAKTVPDVPELDLTPFSND